MKKIISLSAALVMMSAVAFGQTYKPVFAKPLLVGIGNPPSGGVTINANPGSTPFTLQLPIDDGTANQVLTTDGAGILSWAAGGGGGTTFADNVFQIFNNVDITKIATFDAGTIATGTTRTFTFPNVNGTLITSGNLSAITATGTIASGTWNGTAIAPQYGGTGLNTSATATGSILYTSGAGTWAVRGPDADGEVLTLTGGVPTWEPAAGGISGSGTAGRVPRFTGATALGDGVIRDDATNIGIGIAPSVKLDIDGAIVYRVNASVNCTGASTGLGNGNRTYFRVTSDNTPGARALTLTNGTTVGQILIIQCATGTGNGFSIADGGNVRNSGDLARNLDEYDIVQYIWDGSAWCQMLFSTVNP